MDASAKTLQRLEKLVDIAASGAVFVHTLHSEEFARLPDVLDDAAPRLSEQPVYDWLRDALTVRDFRLFIVVGEISWLRSLYREARQFQTGFASVIQDDPAVAEFLRFGFEGHDVGYDFLLPRHSSPDFEASLFQAISILNSQLFTPFIEDVDYFHESLKAIDQSKDMQEFKAAIKTLSEFAVRCFASFEIMEPVPGIDDGIDLRLRREVAQIRSFVQGSSFRFRMPKRTWLTSQERREDPIAGLRETYAIMKRKGPHVGPDEITDKKQHHIRALRIFQALGLYHGYTKSHRRMQREAHEAIQKYQLTPETFTENVF